MNESQERFKELARVGDPLEADLLAAFLEDGDVTFKLIKTAQTMASLMPASQTPIVFHVLEEDLPRARELLQAYREQQSSDSSDESSE